MYIDRNVCKMSMAALNSLGENELSGFYIFVLWAHMSEWHLKVITYPQASLAWGKNILAASNAESSPLFEETLKESQLI